MNLHLNLLTMLGFVLLLSSCAPSDDRMIQHFYEHEAEFEALLAQVDEWSDNWLDVDLSQHSDSYTPRLNDTQIEALQEQLKRLDLIGIGVDQEDVNNAFSAYMVVFSDGTTKGYAYLDDPLDRLIFDENLNSVDV